MLLLNHCINHDQNIERTFFLQILWYNIVFLHLFAFQTYKYNKTYLFFQCFIDSSSYINKCIPRILNEKASNDNTFFCIMHQSKASTNQIVRLGTPLLYTEKKDRHRLNKFLFILFSVPAVFIFAFFSVSVVLHAKKSGERTNNKNNELIRVHGKMFCFFFSSTPHCVRFVQRSSDLIFIHDKVNGEYN